MATYNVRVNGVARTVESSDPNQPLLYVLRGFGLTATKYGCGLGQCGACTVLIDGKATRSCLVPIASCERQVGHHARRARINRETASASVRLHQGTGAAMRLLHQRHDHERGGAC